MHLARGICRQEGEAGYVPAWSRQIFHETTDKRISGTCHDDGNGRSHRPRGTCGNGPVSQDDIDPRVHQRHGKLRQASDISVPPLRNQHEIAPLHPALIRKATQERF